MKKVACGEFVKRQTKESGYSHYEGTWADLEDMVEFHMTYNPKCITPGYRDGKWYRKAIQFFRRYW
jgi:hypothetical protein